MPHIHEKIDYDSDTFIVNGDAVLLRMHDKYKLWLPPGGHIELDEEPQEAAVREVKEEVGLEVLLLGEGENTFPDGEKELLVPRFMNRHRINETHEHISFVFFATSDTREFSQGDTEVSDEIRWFTKEELDNPDFGVTERVKYYAHAALEELGVRK
jgi:8-oxo-dGTP pyrophosphatase MutT (NUDIX family)